MFRTTRLVFWFLIAGLFTITAALPLFWLRKREREWDDEFDDLDWDDDLGEDVDDCLDA